MAAGLKCTRMPADVALMKELGLQAYRFSVAWSRVLVIDEAERAAPLVRAFLAVGVKLLRNFRAELTYARRNRAELWRDRGSNTCRIL